MNSDIRLSVGFWQHPKTKKTARRLGLEGVRSLQVLWLWAAGARPDGNLFGMDWEDIELAADWQGEEHAFFDMCFGMWIDKTVEGYQLHDWKEHNPWAAEAESRSAAGRLSRLSRNHPETVRALRGDGCKGITEEEYRTYASGIPYTGGYKESVRALAGTCKEPASSPGTPVPVPVPVPEEEKTACVFNAGAHVKATCVPEKAPESDAKPAVEPKATPPRQPSVAFDQFLDAYPVEHRGGRTEVEREWVTLEANHALPGLPRILDALGKWEDSERWKAKGGQYVPSAANFLKREYWLQKPPTPEASSQQQRDGPRVPPQQFKTAKMLEAEGRGRFAGNVLAMMNARELEEQEKKHGLTARHCGGIGQAVCALPATGTGQRGI